MDHPWGGGGGWGGEDIEGKEETRIGEEEGDKGGREANFHSVCIYLTTVGWVLIAWLILVFCVFSSQLRFKHCAGTSGNETSL